MYEAQALDNIANNLDDNFFSSVECFVAQEIVPSDGMMRECYQQ